MRERSDQPPTPVILWFSGSQTLFGNLFVLETPFPPWREPKQSFGSNGSQTEFGNQRAGDKLIAERYMLCPVCRARNDQGPPCRRCRVDLSLLFQLEEQRRHYLDRAWGLARMGRWQAARVVLDGVEAIRGDADVQRLRAMSYLLQRDFAQAWRCYQEQATASQT
jgi:hypothetical protein